MRKKGMKKALHRISVIPLMIIFCFFVLGAENDPQADPEIRINWTKGPEIPLPVMEAPSIQVGSRLFVMGGFTVGLDVTSNVQILDLDTLTWRRGASLPQSQTHVGVATDGENIYVAGGEFGANMSGNIRSEVFRYDIKNNVWSELTPLPEPRCAGALVYRDGFLHYFAGVIGDRTTISDQHWSVSITKGAKWTKKAPIINPGDHISSLLLDGLIYAIGGEHDHGGKYIPHDNLSIYNSEKDSWEPKAPLLIPSSHFEAATLAVHGRIVIMGGQGHRSKKIARVHIYNPQTDSWNVATPLPVPVKGGTGAFHQGFLYYVSGRGNVDVKPRASSKDIWIGEILNPWWQ